MKNQWWLRTQDEVFGPVSRDNLLEWARMGRIQPGQDVSSDGENWMPATDLDFLDMRWSIDIGDGQPRGPFNKHAAQALLASGRLPKESILVETVPPPAADPSANSESAEPSSDAEPSGDTEPSGDDGAAIDADESREHGAAAFVPPVTDELNLTIKKLQASLRDAEARVAKAEAKAADAEARVAKAEAKAADAESCISKAEAKAVDAEARAADAEARVAKAEAKAVDAEARVAKAEAKAVDAEARVAKAEAKAVDAEARAADAGMRAKDAEARAADAESRVQDAQDEIKRMPPTALQAADAQAAVYVLMREEADELSAALEAEHKEAELLREYRRARTERLLARRQEILKRIGTDADDMMRRAIKSHPEDPRAAHMRQELDALRILQERSALEAERKINDLSAKLRDSMTDAKRLREQAADITIVYRQLQDTREKLKLREKELVEERQRSENERQQHAATQHALMARVTALESGMPGTTNQSREARTVRLAPWMGLRQ